MARKPIAYGKNKVSGRFEGKIPPGTVPYAFQQQRFSIMDTEMNKQVFSYAIANPKYLGNKEEGTYATESILINSLYFSKNKDAIAELVVSSGFELTKKEVLENLEKARKMGVHDNSILYKGYRFYRMDGLHIKKTY